MAFHHELRVQEQCLECLECMGCCPLFTCKGGHLVQNVAVMDLGKLVCLANVLGTSFRIRVTTLVLSKS